MTSEDQILLTCARQKFTPADIAKVRTLCRQTVRWDSVVECALANGVAPLVYTNLLKTLPDVKLPAEVSARFNKALWETIVVKEKIAMVLAQVLAHFPHEDLMLVKGAALEHSVYEQPWYVWSFDVDLVFRRRRDLFQDQEYAEVAAFFEKVNRSIRPFDQNIEYEFFVHHDLWLNGILPINFERVWRNATSVAVGEHTVYIPSPEDTLLFACVNACRKRYFYLKALCDIAEIITKYPALDWETFTHNAREYRCSLIAYAAMRLTQQTLGASVPAAVLAQLDIGVPRQRLIEFLISVLIQRGALASLSRERGAEIFGRKLGWSLLLTYATYRRDQLIPKMGEIRAGWNRRTAQLAALSRLQSRTTPRAERSRRTIS